MGRKIAVDGCVYSKHAENAASDGDSPNIFHFAVGTILTSALKTKFIFLYQEHFCCCFTCGQEKTAIAYISLQYRIII